MRFGLAMAMVAASVACVTGCSRNDRLYESSPVPQPAASVPSPAPEETVIQRPADKPAQVRLAHMTDAQLAQLILEAAAREAIEEEGDLAVDESVDTLHAELVDDSWREATSLYPKR